MLQVDLYYGATSFVFGAPLCALCRRRVQCCSGRASFVDRCCVLSLARLRAQGDCWLQHTRLVKEVGCSALTTFVPAFVAGLMIIACAD